MDINNLGTFDSIGAVWAAYPEGGIEGDYLFIGTIKYRWNKYDRIWENAATVTVTPARETTTFDGDVLVVNNLTVAGTLKAHTVGQFGCGLFPTSTALETAYPHPTKGMWAIVGDTIPGYIYRCDTDGTWTATGEEGGGDPIDLTEIDGRLDDLEETVGGMSDLSYTVLD